ncbi:ribonucleoside-diphosphate reductase beta chain [Lihuaxuella thermophila]|uniref:R2-like ligand binding oxidase n=2 Tax=Lihuaxuella thermophila TaxID=1173111 RepID=A0A1H8GFT9_9BACL|nr:ribonucleoside-diphosphate reductase beta chain [Lihuaxuella thermophila]
MMREKIITTSTRGINQELFPYQLYKKAKRFGVWNPEDIDFSQDKEDWKKLTDRQREETLGRVAAFLGGEEAVTLDLLPMIMVIAKEGRIEEEMYLTTFLFEEAKHTEFFRLVLNELGETGDLSDFGEAYRKVFFEILPETMERLIHDPSPEALADASTVYNMFVEGVLAETGYYAFYEGLNKAGLMPGLMKGVGYIKTDEARHISYGTFLLQRLICEHPHLYDRVIRKLQELAPLAEKVVGRDLDETVETAFGMKIGDFINYARKQMAVRIEILARAKHLSMEEIYKNSGRNVDAT